MISVSSNTKVENLRWTPYYYYYYYLLYENYYYYRIPIAFNTTIHA